MDLKSRIFCPVNDTTGDIKQFPPLVIPKLELLWTVMGSKVVTIPIWELLHKILLTIPILEIVRSWNDNNFKKNNSNLAVEKNFGDDGHNFKFEIVTFTISKFEIVWNCNGHNFKLWNCSNI